jgi:Mn2+/Fe2+ NRAMP family transporter
MRVHVNRRLTSLLAYGVAGLISALNVVLLAQNLIG